MFTATATGAGGGFGIIIIYIVFFAALMYFMAYRPQKKERKRHEEMMAALAIGDVVETTAGFYGVVIDITDEMVIIEFGSNKNCRIPAKKSAIVAIEKPEA